MNIKTKAMKGIAIQYDGTNIQKIADVFDLSYRELSCTTMWDGKEYPDVVITDYDYIKEDLLAGDYVFRADNSDLVEVIPVQEFGKYWEQDILA